jgi:hypothetical protein
MGNIVNLRRARKNKLRDQSQKDATENRVKYGATKASRLASEAEKSRTSRVADAHKIEKE